MQQDTTDELVSHPHRMELWGEVESVTFPPLCANCGRPANRHLTYKKTFMRVSDSDTPNTWVTPVVRVPFCEPCIAKHRSEGPGPSVFANLLGVLVSGAYLLGTVLFSIAAMAAGYFAFLRLGQGDLKFFYSLVLLGGFLLLFAWGMYSALRSGTEAIRAELQNSITKAFDFSDSTSAAFRTPTFVCTMRDERFATAFRELNKSLIYDPVAPAAQIDRVNARRKFWIAVVVFGGLALLSQLFLAGRT